MAITMVIPSWSIKQGAWPLLSSSGNQPIDALSLFSQPMRMRNKSVKGNGVGSQIYEPHCNLHKSGFK